MSYNNTILIAGGSGFLGSHICDYFQSMNYNVICIDNLFTGNISNLESFLRRGGIFINQDICDPINIDHLLTNSQLIAVLNFASPASPIGYLSLPIETLMTGSIGTKNLLDLALKYNATFLMASTSEVYGDPLEHPQKETYWGNVNPIGIRSVYDESKRFSESLVMSYHRKYGMDTKIVRIFNTYGHRLASNDGRVISNFIDQALTNSDITIYGDGSQTRSFCYVSDLIDGIYRLLISNEHEPVNIGNPVEYSIKEIATIIINITGSKSKIVYKTLPLDDPKVRKPDITKAHTLLNWEPKITLIQGINLTLNKHTPYVL